jgi:hypothetical protein
MPKPPCAQCDRLWREYAQATTTHIHLTGKYRIAQLQYDDSRIKEIAPMVHAAENSRDAAREAIRQHEAKDHGDSMIPSR